jgi:hypothetical protein
VPRRSCGSRTERFRFGAATSVEVTDAQTNLAQAEIEKIDAAYNFHQSLAALEALDRSSTSLMINDDGRRMRSGSGSGSSLGASASSRAR